MLTHCFWNQLSMCRSLPPLLRKLLQDRVLQVVLHGLNMYMSMKLHVCAGPNAAQSQNLNNPPFECFWLGVISLCAIGS